MTSFSRPAVHIIEWRDGGIVVLEVKLVATASSSDTQHLAWLAEQFGADL